MRPFAGAAFALLMFGLSMPALAVPPVVKTVPWVAANPLVAHDTWSGKSIRLKGTVDTMGEAGPFEYSWDFGDGSSTSFAAVTNVYAIEASHAYAGTSGTIFVAQLTVRNTSTGESDHKAYYVKIEDQTLQVETNVAIDEGLWYLLKTMNRVTSGVESCGYWHSGGSASSGYYPNDAVNTNAFFVNGHLQNGSASNPYTETVQRAMCYLPQTLVRRNISTITFPAPVGGPFNTDGNGNGFALYVNQTSYGYTLGPVIDAFVASGEPNRLTTTGNADVIGRTYKDVVQDMVDWYVAAQTYTGTYWGGWDYNGFSSRNDFSVAQWGAIGLIAAEQNFGITIPQWVKDANAHGVVTMQTAAGGFGYDSSGYYPWGEWAVNPSGMVQAVLDGIGRGDPVWDKGETHIRDSFCNNPNSYANTVRGYYYGLFSFTKSMLLHNIGGVSQPITLLQSSTPGVTPIDWYAAEASKGDACDGVARTLVNSQNAAGYWTGNNYSGTQYSFDTAWAIIMLNRTVFESGVPVAVAIATPNPGVVGQTINFNGASSFSQDPSRVIDSWAWDLDNDGLYDDAFGPTASRSFPALGNYPVGLRVTDDGSPEKTATTTVVVQITIPPIAPTADADGPYVFCPQAQPWFLDGSGSVNPDEGQSEPGQPGDTIQSYLWDLDGDSAFDDASGSTPDVTAFFSAQGVGSYLVQLKVTDTTATSYPSSGYSDLSDTDSAQVQVKSATDPACACIDDLAARPKSGEVQLTWTDMGANHYNVYRSTVSGGPYSLIASTTSTYSTYLDVGLTDGTTYYYVVREAALNGDELCQSNEASATPVARVRRR
jgi:hypothetical protein